jgi:hypothetical protein
MPNLSDLRKDLLGLSREELLERISDIREDRKISKKAASVKRERKQKKDNSILKMFESLSPEEKAALLADLEK